MSKAATIKSRTMGTIVLWLILMAGAGLVTLGNVHLVYVAFVSQPDCVDHVKRGGGAAAQGQFSAASSSCTPN